MSLPKTSQNPANFRWTAQRALAAQLVAEDLLNEEEIARKVNVSRRALFAWRMHPAFAARVATILEETRGKLLTGGIRLKENRLRAYDRRWRSLCRVIDERAADPAMADVPGGTTGLLVRHERSVRVCRVDVQDDGSEVVTPVSQWVLLPYYTVDVEVLREIRELEKQAAIEVGDFVQRRDIRIPSGDAPPVLFKLLVAPVAGPEDTDAAH